LDAVATLIDVLETSVNFSVDLPLRAACVYDRNDVAAFLLERGADVNAKSGEPLRIAVRKTNRKLVEVLLEHDADARLSDNDALVTACEMGLEDITRLLLQGGADPNARFGEPLRIAVRKNYKTLVDLLTEHGADVRSMDNEALVTACELGRIDLVQALLRAGADPTARQHKCWRLARQHRNEGLMSVLRSSYFYLTPKIYRNFYSAVYGGDMDAVVAGLESGFDLHHGHDRALRMAASRGHVAMVKLLIQRGANPAALKYQALRLAAYQGSYEVVALLTPLCPDKEILHSAANLAGRRGFDLIRNHLITIALNGMRV
jgi:ankyrin repeat protein